MRYFHLAFLILTAGPADAAPPQFVVENKVPAFTVTNRIPAAPAKTYRTFQDANGQWWQIETAPEVAAPVRPFPQSRTTPDIGAPNAAGVSSSSAAVVPWQGATFTPARRVIRGSTWIGSDGCTSFG